MDTQKGTLVEKLSIEDIQGDDVEVFEETARHNRFTCCCANCCWIRENYEVPEQEDDDFPY